MKGYRLRNTTRAGVNLELALVIMLLVLACVASLSWMGTAIASEFRSASALLVGGVSGGTISDNGDGTMEIGWDGGDAPFTIIRGSDPALSDAVIEGATPDHSYTVLPFPGDNYYQVEDSDGDRLDEPIGYTAPTVRWYHSLCADMDAGFGGAPLPENPMLLTPNAPLVGQTVYAYQLDGLAPPDLDEPWNYPPGQTYYFTGIVRSATSDANGYVEFNNLCQGWWVFDSSAPSLPNSGAPGVVIVGKQYLTEPKTLDRYVEFADPMTIWGWSVVSPTIMEQFATYQGGTVQPLNLLDAMANEH